MSEQNDSPMDQSDNLTPDELRAAIVRYGLDEAGPLMANSLRAAVAWGRMFLAQKAKVESESGYGSWGPEKERIAGAVKEAARAEDNPAWKRRKLSERTIERYCTWAERTRKDPTILERCQTVDQAQREWSLTTKVTVKRVAADELRLLIGEPTEPGQHNPAYRVHPADCRTFTGWPKTVNVIWADPPWNATDEDMRRYGWGDDDLACYRWLLDFAKERLAEGGRLFVQTDTFRMYRVWELFKDHFSYRNTLCIHYYGNVHLGRASGDHVPNWRPVILFTVGTLALDTRPNSAMAGEIEEAVSGRMGRNEKRYFVWQQPVKPIAYWLRCYTQTGEVVADPFAGLGSVGVAARCVGAKIYVGTEGNEDRAKGAQKRIDREAEGSYSLPKP